MNNRMIFLLSLLASLLLPLAQARGAAATDAVPHRGALYRIRHHGNTTYLFGTIHVGLPSFFPLEPEVMQALAGSRRLVVELDARKGAAFQQALQRHGLYAENDAIEQHLSGATLARLKQALQRFDIPYERAARMKPWLLANLLTGLNLERHGYQRSQGIEFHLLAIADKRKMPVQELESADYQMALFDDMAESEQEQYLLENLAQLDDGAALKQDVALIDAWAHANDKAIESMLHDSMAERPASAAFTQRVLLDKRNPQMADKIAALLNEGDASFIAVGLLHLVGENGVPALLSRRGYQVEKLY